MYHKIKQILCSVALCVSLVLPTIAHANPVNETPSAMAMTGDALFVRPLMFVRTSRAARLLIISST